MQRNDLVRLGPAAGALANFPFGSKNYFYLMSVTGEYRLLAREDGSAVDAASAVVKRLPFNQDQVKGGVRLVTR